MVIERKIGDIFKGVATIQVEECYDDEDDFCPYCILNSTCGVNAYQYRKDLTGECEEFKRKDKLPVYFSMNEIYEYTDPTELIKAYEEYIKLLGEELNETAVMASVHHWSSSRIQAGIDLREKIKQLKDKVNAN